MQNSISPKSQAIIVVFGMLLFLVIGIHVSSKEHVNKNGIRLTYTALNDVVKQKYMPEFLRQLNIHQPRQLNQFPDEWFVDPEIKTTLLSVAKTTDGQIRLSGPTYDQMSQYGVRLPLFVIQ